MSLDGPTMDERVPRDFETLRATILDRRESLPKRIAQIAAYALDNPDDIAFGTAASIAASAGVQPSTLIRFAQQLGFDGFTSLQQVFRERLRERNSSYDERLQALRAKAEGGAGHRAIFDGFVAAASTSLNDISRTLDDAHLEEAISLLAKAQTIYVLAKRRSYPVASYIAYALGKLKIRNQLIESAAGLNAEMVSFATPADAVVAISFSPYAPATIEEARTISEQGVPIIAITDSSFSPLAQFASVWFEVAEADFAGFRSLSATMALAMALTVGVGEKRRNPGKGRKA
ncbi:MurR/RpiR family transcriptional regulator [Mesorhizobium sp. B2-2-4]|nr:MurR/RpiR family transcriptional regulator [Mesorhizobium sp. B3-1-1]TPJ06327.1 MurR/RpiR family transcriptional regulator [Mesorhizobium sp. B2-8-1]TPJ39870.1 MurR/RpiR family transcriptional regulator [Mesorhizobium sp. B2-6-6]TPJ50493.1 MurR/RpiR family transcriptional regulator [Mesorhizobium sp. B2-6-4]TPJ61379.1 MurR/RpiR family transcriptional regulator [Mesorhizobium sp. B2-6-7]TPJ66626.1 MurR/RpiR family transcriptional regulator [Mesorhizobium sp. B2-6-1]TPJ78248.1 MurR/RpiR fami